MRKRKQREPRTPAEWQEAVDLAHTYIALDAARLYGLVEGGREINVDRCVELVDRGRERGIVPSSDAVDRCLPAIMSQQ